jgi:uncharacterized membrane protein YeiH
MSGAALLLSLELLGTFAFALNGALTAAQVARLDIVGVITLGVITAVGGGIIRDLLIGAVPPEAFTTWIFLTVAAAGALVVFFLSARLTRFTSAITIMDAAGLSLFCVTGATKALTFGLGPAQAALLGMITAVGGGTLRDMLIGRMPPILSTGLYAIPALVGAAVAVLAVRMGFYNLPAAIVAVGSCFALRMLGVRYNLNVPAMRPPKDTNTNSTDPRVR